MILTICRLVLCCSYPYEGTHKPLLACLGNKENSLLRNSNSNEINCRVRVRVRLMLLDPNSLRHPGYWHNKFHNKLFSLFPKQHTTSLHIVGIMEKYDHIQTGLETIFGLYGVIFSGIYDSI